MYYKVDLIFQIELEKVLKQVLYELFEFMSKEDEGGSEGLNVLFVKKED